MKTKLYEKLYLPRTHLNSYPPALIRFFIGILVLLVALYWRKLFPQWETIEALKILFLLVAYAGLMQIVTGAEEIFFVKDNLRLERLNSMMIEDVRSMKTKLVSVEEITEILSQKRAEIIEILFNDRLVLVGTMITPESKRLFRKQSVPATMRYYIDDTFFDSIEAFRAALTDYAKGEKLKVYTIDEVEVVSE